MQRIAESRDYTERIVGERESYGSASALENVDALSNMDDGLADDGAEGVEVQNSTAFENEEPTIRLLLGRMMTVKRKRMELMLSQWELISMCNKTSLDTKLYDVLSVAAKHFDVQVAQLRLNR